MGKLIFNKSSVETSTVFLVFTFIFGVNSLFGVLKGVGVFCLDKGLGEYTDRRSELTPNFNRDVASILAAGDIVANLSIADVLGLGEGLKSKEY